MLGRGTKWRQGGVLSKRDAIALELISDGESTQHVIVISHDCDLANEKELHVEAIVGNAIPKGEPMLINARNTRRLHLLYHSDKGEALYIDLCQAEKKSIAVEQFVSLTGDPDEKFVLDANQKTVLKQWLAARYGRPAFPDAFEFRLRKEVKKRALEKCIADILDPVSEHLIGIFFDMDSQRGVELPEDEPYYLKILLVYDANEGGENARVAAERAADAISNVFHEVYGKPEDAVEIALDSCAPIADTFLSLDILRKIDQWRVEYISLQSDPAESFLPVGTLPT